VTRRFDTWADLLLSAADTVPDGVAFGVLGQDVAPEEIGRAAFVERAQRVSRGLRELGLRKGSVVVLVGEPSIAWAETFAAVLLAGGMPAPINHRSTAVEFERVMATSGAELAVVSARTSVVDDPGKHDRSRVIVTFEHVDERRPSIEAMYQLQAAAPLRCSESDPAVVLQTSGTTGNPKCVVHSHRSHMEFLDRWTELTMNPDDRVLCFLPMNHQGGLLLSWMAAFSMGAPCYQLSRFSLKGFWDAVHTYGITWTGLMDPVPAYLLGAEKTSQDRAHGLRFVTGSRRPSEMAEMADRFGIRQVRPYGSTETTIVALSVDLDRPEVQGLTPEQAAACAGPPLRDWAFRITQQDGAEAEPSETGALEVRGPSLFSSYLNDPEATDKAFTPDGWFKTGDRAYVNEHGELFFVERSGNAIRRSGENISATEVEATLLEHPEIAEACVLAVPDELRGHEIRACVVRTPGSQLSAEAVFDHCLASLTKYKVPRYVDFWEQFPRTSTFKIARGALDSDPETWVDRYGK
jgi:crotonobetaine/carnitine-CoA ligase